MEKAFGAAPVFIREGGSIPVVETFGRMFGAPVVLLGLGRPDDRAHGPDEKLHLEDFRRGVRVSAWLWEELDWFNANLPVPRVADVRAVFWFRPDAGAPLTRIWSMVRIAEGTGLPVRIYRTRRPGTVVYSDPYQIAAVPWRDTFAEHARSGA